MLTFEKDLISKDELANSQFYFSSTKMSKSIKKDISNRKQKNVGDIGLLMNPSELTFDKIQKIPQPWNKPGFNQFERLIIPLSKPISDLYIDFNKLK